MDKKSITDIVLYQNSPLQRIDLGQLLATTKPKASEVNLASDIFTSQYGVVGFLLVDYKPEEGRGYWAEGEYGWSMSEKHWDEEAGYISSAESPNDLRAKCKNVEIPGTLKIVRYFIMPDAVGKFFKSEKYIGEAMINKIVKEDLIPDDWWGPNSWDEHDFPFSWIANNRYKEIVEGIGEFAKWTSDFRSPENHRAYQSFHLMQDFPTIREVAIESIVKALTRFDNLLSRFDLTGKLKEQRTDLNAEQGRAYPTLYLPGA